MGDHFAHPAAASGWAASRDRHAGGHERGALRVAYGMPMAAVPKDFPPRSTVYNYFWERTRYGVLDRIHRVLLVKVREMEGRSWALARRCGDDRIVNASQIKHLDGRGKPRPRSASDAIAVQGLERAYAADRWWRPAKRAHDFVSGVNSKPVRSSFFNRSDWTMVWREICWLTHAGALPLIETIR